MPTARSQLEEDGLRSLRRTIPSFSLYGEHEPAAPTGLVHIEDIQSRSRKYLWSISAHRHSILCQCIFLTRGFASVVLEESRTHFNGPACIIVPAGTIHSFRFGPETQGYVLTTNLQQLVTFATVAYQNPIEA